MIQAIAFTTPNLNNGRLMLALQLTADKPTSNSKTRSYWQYPGLVYQLNKEDELDRTLYQEETENNDSEEEFDDEENTQDNDDEEYEFNSHRHK